MSRGAISPPASAMTIGTTSSATGHGEQHGTPRRSARAEILETPAGQQGDREHGEDHDAQVVAGAHHRDAGGDVGQRRDAEGNRQREQREQRHARPHASSGG